MIFQTAFYFKEHLMKIYIAAQMSA